MTSEKGNTRVTRADVAAKAGISPTTVAYVLNETPGVKIREETRSKVLEAAKSLGYTPSFSARSMKRGKTELVGILLPALTSQFHPYYAQMLHGVYEAAADSDYHFLLLTQERVAKYERCLGQNYVDGVLVIQSDADSTHLKRVVDSNLPVVSLNSLHDCKTQQVTMDYEAAMQTAVETLVGQGARKLLFVHGKWNNQPIQRYLATFKELQDQHHDAAMRFDHMGTDRYMLEPEQISHLLSEGWDGVIVDGYELARDIARHPVFGQEDEPVSMVAFSETAAPAPLGKRVTILQSQPQISGRVAWQQLHSLLDGKRPRQTVYRVPFSLFNPESK